MKILHYIPTYAPAWKWGGPVRSVSELCEGLAARGHDVTVFTTNAGLNNDPDLVTNVGTVRNGVVVHYFPQDPGLGIKSRGLESAILHRAGEFEVIHLTAVWQRTGPAAASAAKRSRRPWVVSPRGALGPYSWRRGTLKKVIYYLWKERTTLKGAAGFHFTSRMEAEECGRFLSGQPTCIIPNPIDLRVWRRDIKGAEKWRSDLRCLPEEMLILYVGRLHHKKGLGLLAKTFERIRDLKWRLVLIGEDEDGSGSRLQKEFFQRGLTDRLIIRQPVPPCELPALYSAANALVLPSLHENFGNVTVEAAACGCHVLASDQTGAAEELARIGVASRLPLKSEIWASALRGLYSAQPRTPASMEEVRRCFSRELVAERMEKFYENILLNCDAGLESKYTDINQTNKNPQT